MTDEPLAFSPDQFSGRARIFALPNLVMFPHVMQALHIYETRYRAMLEEAIEDDRLIALGVLAPGWEENYEGRPTLRSTERIMAPYTRLRWSCICGKAS